MPTGCYQFFQDSKNWSEAQRLCQRRGGRLAELEGKVRNGSVKYCGLITGIRNIANGNRNTNQRQTTVAVQSTTRDRESNKTFFTGFDKQMDVVNLYSTGGHSPACFWIGGYESDPESMVFTWNVSARVMDKYFIEWESGYPKNRWALQIFWILIHINVVYIIVWGGRIILY